MNLVDMMLGQQQQGMSPFAYGLLGVASQIGNPQGNAAAGYLQGLGEFQQSQYNQMRMRGLQQEAAMQRAKMQQDMAMQQKAAAIAKQWRSSGDKTLAELADIIELNPMLLNQVLPQAYKLLHPQPQMEVINGRIMERDQNGNWMEKANIPPQQSGVGPGGGMNLGDKARVFKTLVDTGKYPLDQAAQIAGIELPKAPSTAGSDIAGYLPPDQVENYTGYQTLKRLVNDGLSMMDNPETSGAAYTFMQGINDWVSTAQGILEFTKKFGFKKADAAQQFLEKFRQKGVTEWRVKMGMLEMQVRALFTPEKRMSDKDREYLIERMQVLFAGATPDTIKESLTTLENEYRLALTGQLEAVMSPEFKAQWAKDHPNETSQNRFGLGRTSGTSVGTAAEQQKRADFEARLKAAEGM